MARRKGSPARSKSQRSARAGPDKPLRIIGGTFRGRSILYTGDPRTRPMKDRVREAVFNLIGPAVKGKHAIDLFAGTGALGLEALSRGAARATFIERHFPTSRIIEQNIAALDVGGQSEVVAANVFLWVRRQQDWAELTDSTWLVLCSPPYGFYVDCIGDMLELLRSLHDRAPQGSLFMVEADERFDFGRLADLGDWDVRTYPPAVIGISSVPGQ
jgi:16S rRNA (guanine966-N2)-methyltransferase